MCGIFCSLVASGCCDGDVPDALEACLSNLQKRGPDHFQSMECKLSPCHRLKFAASVLRTQGEKVCLQPYSKDKNVLCWNGDVFSGQLAKEVQDSTLCDTEVVFKHLSESVRQGLTPADVFNLIEGPYSFIFYNEERQTIWFGRDPAGRHSLLYELTEHPFSLTLTSVGHSSLSNLREVPAVGLFEVCINAALNQNDVSISLHPWREMESEIISEHCVGLPNMEIKTPVCHHYIFSPSCFNHLQLNEVQLQPFFKNLVLSAEDKMKALSNLENFSQNMLEVLHLLEAAVKIRVDTNVTLCQNCISVSDAARDPCCHPKVAVLFSGGLDSAILARLADKFVPKNEPIDLLNVAFEKKKAKLNKATKINKRSELNSQHFNDEGSLSDESDLYNVPDRLSGRKTLKELQSLCPERQWNFIEINVPAAELQEERSRCIGHLIHPLKTILDDSLGCALWFAARGEGKIGGSCEYYKSPARVVITGMGADEQFGGYMRHRTTLKNHGWEALYNQLQMELERIPSRNLGRDDRVISHHGRQPRMPFLDESVIKFVKSLPPWERCCPNDELPCGIGDKLLLRLVAWHIGLQGAAILPKRAMQFGSRIANSKENAADTSDRL